MMKIKESGYYKGYVGLFVKDEFGHLEEGITLSKRNAKKLAEDILKYLKPPNPAH